MKKIDASNGFAKMYWDLFDYVSEGAATLLCYLIDKMPVCRHKRADGFVRVSNGFINDYLNRTAPTIRKQLSELEEAGYIEIEIDESKPCAKERWIRLNVEVVNGNDNGNTNGNTNGKCNGNTNGKKFSINNTMIPKTMIPNTINSDTKDSNDYDKELVKDNSYSSSKEEEASSYEESSNNISLDTSIPLAKTKEIEDFCLVNNKFDGPAPASEPEHIKQEKTKKSDKSPEKVFSWIKKQNLGESEELMEAWYRTFLVGQVTISFLENIIKTFGTGNELYNALNIALNRGWHDIRKEWVDDCKRNKSNKVNNFSLFKIAQESKGLDFSQEW